jgi:hypothetical protein
LYHFRHCLVRDTLRGELGGLRQKRLQIAALTAMHHLPQPDLDLTGTKQSALG